MSVEYKVYGYLFLEVRNECFYNNVLSVLIPLIVSSLLIVFFITRAPRPPSLLDVHCTGCPYENSGSWVPHKACIRISGSRCSGRGILKVLFRDASVHQRLSTNILQGNIIVCKWLIYSLQIR